MSFAMNVDQLFAFAETNDNGKPALIDSAARQVTIPQMMQDIKSMAGGCVQLNLPAKSKIAILALNSIESLQMLYAIILAGHVSVPLNLRWTPSELAVAIDDSNSQVLVVDDTFAPMVAPILAASQSIQKVIYLGTQEAQIQGLSLTEFLAEPIKFNLRRDPSEEALICYTSGTTGSPKGVVHTHHSIMAGAEVCALSNMPQKEHLYLSCFPYFHIAGYLIAFSRILQQATQFIVPMFRPDIIINALKNVQIDELGMAPTMIQMLINDEQFNAQDFAQVKGILYGSSPIAAGLLKQLQDCLPHINLVQGYGMTEAGIFCFLPPQFHQGELARISAAGQVTTPINQVLIEDDKGQELAIGEIGEVVIYGPTIMSHYHNKPEQTAETRVRGGIRSGDLGYKDEMGVIFLKDRKKDMIITGGENVYSSEVESAISLHPDVALVAVIGIFHEKWGEAVHAVIQPKAGKNPTQEDILDFLRGNLAGYKCPYSVSFIEQMPLSSTNKILKHQLRQPFWQKVH